MKNIKMPWKPHAPAKPKKPEKSDYPLSLLIHTISDHNAVLTKECLDSFDFDEITFDVHNDWYEDDYCNLDFTMRFWKKNGLDQAAYDRALDVYDIALEQYPEKLKEYKLALAKYKEDKIKYDEYLEKKKKVYEEKMRKKWSKS